MLALALGVTVSYLFDRSDRRGSRLGELETLFDLPVLATMPHSRTFVVGPTREDSYRIAFVFRESFRSLRVNLDIALAARGAKVIMVATPMTTHPQNDRSTVYFPVSQGPHRLFLARCHRRGLGLARCLAQNDSASLSGAPIGRHDHRFP